MKLQRTNLAGVHSEGPQKSKCPLSIPLYIDLQCNSLPVLIISIKGYINKVQTVYIKFKKKLKIKAHSQIFSFTEIIRPGNKPDQHGYFRIRLRKKN